MFNTRNMTTMLATIALCSVAAHAQDFDLSWHTIDGGGGTSTSEVFELSGTIGQHDAGRMTGGEFALSGGFWPGAGGAPPATGACCLPDGACEDGLTEPGCSQKEGVQWHEGKACDEVECPPPGGCNGKEAISKAKCKTKRGNVKKVIVLVKKSTPGETYTATLDTGQQLEKKAKKSGKAKFTFKGDNRPECGPNGVTVCEQLRAFNCGC